MIFDIQDFTAVDLETFYSDEVSLGYGKMSVDDYIRHPEFKVHMFAVRRYGKRTRCYPGKELRYVMRDLPKDMLVAHNAEFEGKVLAEHADAIFAKYACTVKLFKLVFPNLPGSLANVAKTLWPDDPNKRKLDGLDDTKGFWELSEEQYENLVPYNKRDTSLCHDIFLDLLRDLSKEDLDSVSTKIWRKINSFLNASAAIRW